MNFKSLIENIKTRPGMYIGSLELSDLRLFLDGYLFFDYFNKLNDQFEENFRENFNTWVWRKLLKANLSNELYDNLKFQNGRGYVELIKVVESNPKKQLDIFFNYFDEFYDEYLNGSSKFWIN